MIPPSWRRFLTRLSSDPNRDAIETLARRLYAHYDEQQPGFFEGVIDAATGVGKTYAMAGALDYLAAQGVRNFAVIAPGATILEKTIAQFTAGTPRSLVGRMACEPFVVHAGNFDTPAIAAARGRRRREAVRVHRAGTDEANREGRPQDTYLPRGPWHGLYAHLQALEDLVVFADEHHCYGGPKFSQAIRNLDPLAMIGLTATPERRSLKEACRSSSATRWRRLSLTGSSRRR